MRKVNDNPIQLEKRKHENAYQHFKVQFFLDNKSRQERLENPDIKCFGTDRTLKQNQNVTFDGTVSAYNASGVDINNKKERKEIQTGLT